MVGLTIFLLLQFYIRRCIYTFMEETRDHKLKTFLSPRFFGGAFIIAGLFLAVLLSVWVFSGRSQTLERLRFFNANMVYDVSQMMDIYKTANENASKNKTELLEGFINEHYSVLQIPEALESDFFILDSVGRMVFYKDERLLEENLLFSGERFFQNVPTNKQVGLFSGSSPSGETGYVAAYYHEPLDIIIAMHTPEHVAFRWMVIPLVLSLVLLVTFGLFFLFLGSYFYRLLQRPVAIHKAISEVKEGNYNYRLEEEDLAGVDAVAVSFNEMLEGIVEQINVLNGEKATYKSSERLKSNLVGVVTKRLFVPLKTLKMDLETLLGGGLGRMNSASTSFLRLIHRKTANVISTVEDLVLVDEMGSNRFIINREITNLEILTNIVLDELDGLIQAKRLKVDIQKSEEILPEIFIDSYKIKKVIFKLISNGIKFSKDNGKLEINLSHKDNSVLFSVKDHGAGIGRAEQGRVFGKFFRAGSISLSHPEASGLSLFIAQKIIEEHGGKIWFESQIGKGSHFIFSLPLEENYA